MDAKEVQLLLQKLATEYSGNTYNLITRNCNHFCNDLCMRLTKKSIPNWVNRLARLGNNLHGCYFSLHSIFYFLIFWVVGRVGLLQSICIYLGLKICLLSWVVGCYHLQKCMLFFFFSFSVSFSFHIMKSWYRVFPKLHSFFYSSHD